MSCPIDQVHPARRPAVVLLHSSASSARQWENLVGTLTAGYRVYTVELHGHGRQTDWRGDSPLTLADEAALVEPLLEEVGGAHVVGHSYGAAVALKLASMRPALVRSVVAYEPVMFRWLSDDRTDPRPLQEIVAFANSIRDRIAQGHDHSAAQRFVDFWSGAGSWESLPGGARDSIAARMRAVLGHFHALFREPLQRAQLAIPGMPMLFMNGARTVGVMHRVADLVRDALPDARYEVLPGMGHMGPITHAAAVNRRITGFLRSHTGSDLAFEELAEV